MVFAFATAALGLLLAHSPRSVASPPAPSHPVKVYGFGTANCGPNFRLSFKITYDNVVTVNRTFEHGQTIDLPASSQSFNAGKVLKVEVSIIRKSDGRNYGTGYWEGTMNFSDRRDPLIYTGSPEAPPGFRYSVIKDGPYYGEWLVQFSGRGYPAP